jgi:hypothetical protein
LNPDLIGSYSQVHLTSALLSVAEDVRIFKLGSPTADNLSQT